MGVGKRKKTPKPLPDFEDIQPVNKHDLQRALRGELKVAHVKGSRKAHDENQKRLEREHHAKTPAQPTDNIIKETKSDTRGRRENRKKKESELNSHRSSSLHTQTLHNQGRASSQSSTLPEKSTAGKTSKRTKSSRKSLYRPEAHTNKPYSLASGKFVVNRATQTDKIDMREFFQEDLTERPPPESIMIGRSRDIQSVPVSEKYLQFMAQRMQRKRKSKVDNVTKDDAAGGGLTGLPILGHPRTSVNTNPSFLATTASQSRLTSGRPLKSPLPTTSSARRQEKQKEKHKHKDKLLLPRKYTTFKKHLKHVYAMSHTFEVQSSSSSTDNETFYKDQRDSEWLQFTSSESSHDIPMMEYEEEMQNRSSESPLEIQSEELNKATKALFWYLKFGGRLPVQSYVEDRVVKFRINKCSSEYIYFLITSFFLILCTIMMFMSLSEIFLRPGVHTSSFIVLIEDIEFAKYGVYGIVTLFYLTIASLWSLGMIFQDGYYFADYLTRWNLIQVQLKLYSEYEGVKSILFLSITWFILYSGVITALFITANIIEFEPVPAIRGTTNLLIQSIFRLFIPGIRFKPQFSYLGGIGLFIHLYAIYSAQIIMLIVLVYCKIIENMGRRWNLRTAYVLGMLGDEKSSRQYVTYHTVIPFTKLFAEHNFIVFLQKYTGKLFSVGLNGYFVFKGLELIALFYHIITLLIYPTPPPPSKFVEGTPNKENITFIDSFNNVMMTGIFYTGQSLIGWLWTTDHLRTAGYCIMCGYNFIRRYGLVRCRNSKERRFVLSMQFSFAPVADYFLNPGVKINRKFILEMLFWIGTITALLIVFNPNRLQTDTVTVCQNDTCVHLSVRKSYWVLGSDKRKITDNFNQTVQNIQGNLQPLPTTTTTTSTITPNTTITSPTTTTSSTTTATTTTLSCPSIRSIFHQPRFEICNGSNVSGEWKPGYQVQLILGCMNPACNPKPDPRDKIIPFVDGSGATRWCPPLDPLIGTSIPYNDKDDIFNCVGLNNQVDKTERDFCGNLPFSAPLRQNASLAAVRVNAEVKGTKDLWIGCCYDYGFSDQVRFCNVVSPNLFPNQCGAGNWRLEFDIEDSNFNFKAYFDSLDAFFDQPSLGIPSRFDFVNDCFCKFKNNQIVVKPSGTKFHCVPV